MPIWVIVLFILSIYLVWFFYSMYYISNAVKVNWWVVAGLPIFSILPILWALSTYGTKPQIDHVLVYPVHTRVGELDRMYSYIHTEEDGDIIITGIENRVYPENKFVYKRIIYKQWYNGIYFYIPDKIRIEVK